MTDLEKEDPRAGRAMKPRALRALRQKLRQIEKDRARVHGEIDQLYWVFTRQARGVPPAATPYGASLYRLRRSLDEQIAELRRSIDIARATPVG